MGPAACVTSSAIMGGMLGWALWRACGDPEEHKAVLPLVICAGRAVGAIITAASEIIRAIDRWDKRCVEAIEESATASGDVGSAPALKGAADTRIRAKR
jgi:hypothetical protein